MTNKQQIEQESVSNEFLSGSLNYLDQVQDVKPYKTHRSLKPLIVALSVIAVLCGGVLTVLDTTNHAPEEAATNAPTAEVSDTQVQLAACLRTADLNNVEVGDPEFYPKLIANYKEQIACYDKFDGDNPEIESLREHLSSIEIAARDAGISQAAIDAEYERRAAQIEKEHRQQMAALDAKAAQQDEETRRKLEQSDAEWAKLKTEQETQRAQYEAQRAKCDAFKQKYNNQDGLTVAQNDSEVQELWRQYEEAQQQYQEASAALTGAISGGSSQRTIDYWQTELHRRNSIMGSISAKYNATVQQVKLNYDRERNAACGY